MTDLRPDKLAVNYEEAKGFLSEARLHKKVLVLEDQFHGQPQGGFATRRGAKQWAKRNLKQITSVSQVDTF